MLGALMRGCAEAHYPIAMDGGWEDWDLEVAGGPAGGARLLIAGENHGADKRLLRIRSALRPSGVACAVIGGLGALILVGLMFGGMIAATIFAVLAAVVVGVAIWQLALFARRLHAVIEAAAQETALVPVAPPAFCIA